MPASARRSLRSAQLIVVGIWLAAAIVMNVALAVLNSSQSFDSAGHATDAPGQPFPGTSTDAIAYLVARDPSASGPSEPHDYDAVIDALREDTNHVGAVLDWSSAPLTAPMETSADGATAVALIWLVGEAGTSRAADSLEAVRSSLRVQPQTSHLQARITAPGTTASTSPALRPWQGALIVVAATLAVGAATRRRLPTATVVKVALAAAITVAVAWPLVVWLNATMHTDDARAPMAAAILPAAISALIVVGTLAISANSASQPLHRRALPGLCAILLTGPLLLAHTPLLRDGIGVGVLAAGVALIASLTLLPALLRDRGELAPEADGGTTEAPLFFANPRVALAVTIALAASALSLASIRLTSADTPAGASLAADGAAVQSLDGSPDVVTIRAQADLRNPAGLVAVDRVSRDLMDVPGVRRVQSAAWPQGVPWSEATLAHAAGRLGEQLQRQATALLPLVNSIKSLSSAVDQVDSGVGQLSTAVNAGVAGLEDMHQAVDLVVTGTTNVKQTVRQVSASLDPIRDWTSGVPDCPASQLCSAALKVTEPFDSVAANVAILSDGADRIAAGFDRTSRAIGTAPRSVLQLQSAVNTLRPLVPTLQNTVEDTIPQVVQLSAFLRNLAADFDGTGEGGFYLSRKALADPTYRVVRDAMFSPDGTTTRLFVFSDAARPDPTYHTSARQLRTAVERATKYGPLTQSQVGFRGSATIAASARSALDHDLVLQAALLLAVSAAIGWRTGTARAAFVFLGVTTACLVALGVTAAVWQQLLGHALYVGVLPTSIAVITLVGVPCLAAAGTTRRSTATAPWLGGTLGLGLCLASIGFDSALVQLGGCVLVGIAALMLVTRMVPEAPAAQPRVSQS